VKALLILMQFVLFIVGVYQVFQGRWWVLLICWAGAILLGLIVTRSSGSGPVDNRAVHLLTQAGQKLDEQDFEAADNLLSTAIQILRSKGEHALLAATYPLQAVTKVALDQEDAAYEALDAATTHINNLPMESSNNAPAMRQTVRTLRMQILSKNTSVEQMLQAASSTELH